MEEDGHDHDDLNNKQTNDNSTQNKKKSSYQNMPPGTYAPIVEIDSPEALATFLNEDDRITVIKYVKKRPTG